MSQIFPSVMENISQNNIQNSNGDAFSEMKNYIFSLEKNLKDQEIDINNLKSTIMNLEQDKISLIQELDKKDSIINEISNSLENFKNQCKQNQNKINELESENRTLNYSNIKLTQRNNSLVLTKYSIKKIKKKYS